MRADNSSLVNDIYVSLKQDILWLRLKPRTTLTESELAEIYKTSKTPIREALSMLVRDELVSVFPRKGYMVTEVSLTDMRDMHQYRYILENANLVYAVKHATKEQLARLDELAEQDRYYTEDEPHFSKEVISNNAFHFYLAEMTGNRILVKQLTDTLEKAPAHNVLRRREKLHVPRLRGAPRACAPHRGQGARKGAARPLPHTSARGARAHLAGAQHLEAVLKPCRGRASRIGARLCSG